METETVLLPPTLRGDPHHFLEKLLQAWIRERGFVATPGVYRGRRGVYVENGREWSWIWVDDGAVKLVGAGRLVGELKDYLKERFLSAYYYEGRGHIYLVYAGEESVTPSLREGFVKVVARKLLAENMVYAFFLAALVSVIIYETLGPLAAPLAIGFVSIFAITVSPYIAPRIVAHWRIREGEPIIIVDIEVGGKEYRRNYGYLADRRLLLGLKREVWRLLTAGSLDEASIVHLLSRLAGGLTISREAVKVSVKRYELHEIVARLAGKLGGVKPRGVFLYNVLFRNAMSIGVGGHSAVILTSGLLVDMEGGEVAAVIGHELSHLYRWDILLFTLVAVAEYGARMYYFFLYNPALLMYPVFVLGYLLLAMTGIFMFAKLLELRADMDVIAGGYGGHLASALIKIGYPSLLEEKSLLGRIVEWLSWRPHPPLRYRVALAERYSVKPPKNVWLAAFSALLYGLLRAA